MVDLAGHDARFNTLLAAAFAEHVETALDRERQRDAAVGADVGDIAMAERDEMPGGERRALLIVDVDGGGESAFLGLDGVDADDRHAHGGELRAFPCVDIEGDDDDGVGVATHRKRVEELFAILDAGDLED